MSVGMRVVCPHTTPTDRQWLHTGEGGAQASAHLVPAVLALLAQAGTSLAELDALVWGCGPGSFTGLRTAAAVAQGLAYGTRPPRHPNGLPVLSVDTLLAVAEEARHQLCPADSTPAPAPTACTITALLDARMDEVYAATYLFPDISQPQATRLGGPWLLKPEGLTGLLDNLPGDAAQTGVLAGNVFGVYGERIPATSGPRVVAMPTAAALLRLAPGLLAQGLATPAAHAQPVYVRDKVAQTTAERATHPTTAITSPQP